MAVSNEYGEGGNIQVGVAIATDDDDSFAIVTDVQTDESGNTQISLDNGTELSYDADSEPNIW